MTDFRDWPRTLRPASFRGVRFFVEKDSIDTGRRLEVHEFPHRDVPYVEDLGRKANKVSVTAYVLSDRADAEQRALMAACGSAGPATLSLPMERLKAHCESCQRSFQKDRLGYVAFDISFVRDGGAGAAPYPAAYLARLVSAAAGSVVTALVAHFAGIYKTRGSASFVLSSAAAQIRAKVAEIDAVRATLPLPPAKAPQARQKLQAIYDAAGTLAEAGDVGDRYERRAFLSATAAPAASALVTELSGALEFMRAAAEPEHAVAAFAILTEPDDGAAAVPLTPSRIQDAANTRAIDTVVRSLALAEWAIAVTDRTFTDRRQAIAARAEIQERFDAVLTTMAGPESYGVALALSEVKGQAIEYLSRLLTDLAPVVVAESHVSMPALWWANTLYGDAARAPELVARNSAFHAGFMPLAIEALAAR